MVADNTGVEVSEPGVTGSPTASCHRLLLIRYNFFLLHLLADTVTVRPRVPNAEITNVKTNGGQLWLMHLPTMPRLT